MCSCNKNENVLSENEIYEIIKTEDEKRSGTHTKYNDYRDHYELVGQVTSDGENIFCPHYFYYFNMLTGEKKTMCEKPNCEHNNEKCMKNFFGHCSVCCYYNNGFLATSGSSLVHIVDGEIIKLFDNKKHGASAEKRDSDVNYDPNGISEFIFLNENNLFMIGRNYGFTYNLETKKQGTLIDIGEAAWFESLYKYDDNNVVLHNIDGELFIVNIENSSAKKIDDHVVRTRVFDKYIYIIEYIEGIRKLYKLDPASGEKTFVMEDVGYWYYVLPDGSLIFSYFGNDHLLFKADSNGEVIGKIEFGKNEDGFSYRNVGVYEFSFTDNMFIELYAEREREENGATKEANKSFVEIDKDLKIVASYGDAIYPTDGNN